MRKKETIVVDVTPEGDVRISVEGAEGSACLTLTKAMEHDLGTTLTRTPTADMRRRAAIATLQRHDI